MRTTAALVLVGSLLLATPAFAAERPAREPRGGSASTPVPAPVVTPVPQQPITPGIHYSNTSHGNISNNTSTNTNSGNNQGSNVVTGNQSNTVTVVNIGPTNNNNSPVVTPPAQPQQPGPSCTDRMCPRVR